MRNAPNRRYNAYEPRPDLKDVDPLLYQVVSARRLQWDNLLWQVPVISLTGQAFLSTIALSGGNTRLARVIASILALVAALLSMQLMSRQRQAEITDAQWLRAYEEANFTTAFTGQPWQNQRDKTTVGLFFSRLPGYSTWMAGFGVFAAAAIAVFLVALLSPGAL
jgi:hypothetical protein